MNLFGRFFGYPPLQLLFVGRLRESTGFSVFVIIIVVSGWLLLLVVVIQLNVQALLLP